MFSFVKWCNWPESWERFICLHRVQPEYGLAPECVLYVKYIQFYINGVFTLIENVPKLIDNTNKGRIKVYFKVPGVQDGPGITSETISLDSYLVFFNFINDINVVTENCRLKLKKLNMNITLKWARRCNLSHQRVMMLYISWRTFIPLVSIQIKTIDGSIRIGVFYFATKHKQTVLVIADFMALARGYHLFERFIFSRLQNKSVKICIIIINVCFINIVQQYFCIAFEKSPPTK